MKILKYVLIGIAALFAINIVFSLAVGLLGLVLKVVVPIAVIGGIGYVVYKFATRDKALPGSRKSLL